MSLFPRQPCWRYSTVKSPCQTWETRVVLVNSALFFVFLEVDHLATEFALNFSIVAIIVSLK
jgi:hypothetical protein